MLIPSWAFGPVIAPAYPMVVPAGHFALPSPAAVTASPGTSMEVWTGRLFSPESLVPPLLILLAHPAVRRATAANAANALPGRVTVPPWSCPGWTKVFSLPFLAQAIGHARGFGPLFTW